jgi:hypothetical protein
MSTFWQNVIPVVIPAALALLVAYRGAISSTSRLISAIRVNVELLDKLPADDPTRAKLEARNGELVNVLTWRQRQQFHPLALRTGPRFRLVVPLTVVMVLLWVALMLAWFAGGYRPESLTPETLWLALAFYVTAMVAMVGLARSTSKLTRQLQEVLLADAEPDQA